MGDQNDDNFTDDPSKFENAEEACQVPSGAVNSILSDSRNSTEVFLSITIRMHDLVRRLRIQRRRSTMPVSVETN